MAFEIGKNRITGFWMLAMTAASLTATLPVRAEESTARPDQGGMLCTDGMATGPDTDDLEAIAVSTQVDGGCLVPNGPVGI